MIMQMSVFIFFRVGIKKSGVILNNDCKKSVFLQIGLFVPGRLFEPIMAE